MTISGFSNNSYNYRTTTNYGNNQSSNNMDVASKEQRPQGPPPGEGPRGGGKGPQGPDLDTDQDGSWSSSEVEEYASYSASALGIELNSEDIMSTYDTDGDGNISSEESVQLKDDNAFNLPSPKDQMEQMRGFHQMPPQQSESNESSESSIDSENSVSAYMINQLMTAYNQSTDPIIPEMLSTVTYDI